MIKVKIVLWNLNAIKSDLKVDWGHYETAKLFWVVAGFVETGYYHVDLYLGEVA
jgi:hypothetical protein